MQRARSQAKSIIANSKSGRTATSTPAMEAGITNHVWSLDELCALLPKPVVRASEIERSLIQKALGE